jgi:transcription elongation factor GreA
MNAVPMTPQGFQALQEELKHLKTTVRPAVINDIAEARSHGDLSENAEYDAAREKQSFVEARIRDIEGKIARAQVIDASKVGGDRVIFGATVTIYDMDSETEQTWTIVGDDEADLKQLRIGISSPLARALVGKALGDQIEIRTPGGKRECEILKISF